MTVWMVGQHLVHHVDVHVDVHHVRVRRQLRPRAEWMGSPMTVWRVGQHLVHPVHVRRQELLAAYLLTLPAWLQHLQAARDMTV